MIRNYFKIAWRNLIRHRSFAFLNIAGLAIGLAASMLILAWVQHEESYDRFHEHADQLYRLTADLDQDDFRVAITPPPLTPELKAKMPEVIDFVRVTPPQTNYFEYNDNRYEEKAGLYADPNFLDVFTFPLIAGDRTTALQQPDGIVITERLAKKYFKDDNPIGKTLEINHSQAVTVMAVLADVPTNSHLQFDYILPFNFLSRDNYLYPNNTQDDWGDFKYYSYVKVKESLAPEARTALEGNITRLYREHVEGALRKSNLQLQPLKNIHLHSQKLQVDLAGQGNSQYVQTLFFIAIFILIVACINFMNLATARSARRAKEVGLYKVIGAHRIQLVMQFMGEALLIAYLSYLLALGLAWVCLPLFNHISDTVLDPNLFHPQFLMTSFGIATLTGLVAGIYPALYLSNFAPVKVLKGAVTGANSGNLVFRNVLVVIQFVVSITLLVGTILTYQQLNYLKNRDLGFDQSGLVYVPMIGDIWGQQQAYKDALHDNPLTADFSVTEDLPTNLESGTIDYNFEGKEPNSSVIVAEIDVDEHFLDVFDMQLLTGRGFSRQFGNESNNYVVNETLVKMMGLSPEEAIGKPFELWSRKGTIIGVVKDFNFKPASQVIQPLLLRYNDWGGMVVVKARTQELEATLKALEKINAQLNPNFPFSYGFVNQDLERLYVGEQRLSNLFNFFAVLAIFVSCLGLYGLSAYIAERRTKEIGVRKVLGASVMHLTTMLSMDFIKLPLIAMAIATPMAWWTMNKWLNEFAYRIDIRWWVFALAGGLSLVIAVITVSTQAVRAATANPVNSLRDE